MGTFSVQDHEVKIIHAQIWSFSDQNLPISSYFGTALDHLLLLGGPLHEPVGGPLLTKVWGPIIPYFPVSRIITDWSFRNSSLTF